MIHSLGPDWYRRSNRRIWLFFVALCIWALLGIVHGLAQLVHKRRHQLTVTLVLAATHKDNLSWASNLAIPNLKIIPYIADNSSAPNHPPLNKGHEALTYLTYLHNFYDELSDISIFTHASDVAWHMDPIFKKSTAFAINNLDLREVLRRQYVNLKVDWRPGCVATSWMNTTSSLYSRIKQEEPFMGQAFAENFPNDTVPEILAQPCCSQFAVTKEAVRLVPKWRYREFMTWIINTRHQDSISGRVWEHMWQWLFLRKAVDCPVEHKALCRGFHICFESQEEWEGWKKLHGRIEDKKKEIREKEKKQESRKKDKQKEVNKEKKQEINKEKERKIKEKGKDNARKAERGEQKFEWRKKLELEIEALGIELEGWRADALQRGMSAKYRKQVAGDLGP